MAQRDLGPAAELDIVGRDAIRDPHVYFGKLRESEPVVWDTRSRSWIVSQYELVRRGLLDQENFSSDRIRPFIQKKIGPDTDPLVRRAFDVLTNWLVFNDPPKHTRLRMLVQKAFASKAVARLADRFAGLCDEILAGLPDAGEINFLDDVAMPYSASVISEMLGVPRSDRGRFEEWHKLFGPIIGASLSDAGKYESLARGVDDLITYVHELLDRYRRAPEDNFLSELIRAREEDEVLSEEEIVSTCTLVLFAGSETTANLMANGLRCLLETPDQMALLRSGKIKIADAVEELLRFDGSGKAVTRVVRQDNSALGVPMRAGQRVFFVLAAADRDREIFEAADDLKLDRANARKHLAFGHGPHICLGMQLARLETSIAIPKALAKWGYIELAGDLDWHPQLLSRGLTALPIKVAP